MRRRWLRAGPLLGGMLVLGACADGPPVVQPIQFNHKAHVDSGLACDGCHQSVREAAAASVPTKETCLGCHQQAITESPEEEKVRGFAERGEDIPWRQIYTVPEHVYFSHQRHVAAGGIECGQCHGAVETLTAPAPRPLVRQTMDWCLACHRARGVTEECIHCHV